MNFNYLKYISYFLDSKKDFTVRFTKNNNFIIPNCGFIVSITPLLKINMDLNSILNYIEKNSTIKVFNEVYPLYVGGWFKDNNFNLDISIVENNRQKAINIGRYCNQKAIYDIENKITIYLNKGLIY